MTTTAVPRLIEQFERERNVAAIDIAAALASLVQGGTPLLLPERVDRAAEGHAPGREVGPVVDLVSGGDRARQEGICCPE